MRYILSLAIALTLLAGCASRQAAAPTADPQPSAAPTTAAPQSSPTPASAATSDPTAPLDLEAARASIQATLDDYAQAYERNDAALLQSAVDQSNAPFRRLVQDRFDSYQASVLAGGGPLLRVDELELRELGFVLARIESDGGARYDWLFREIDGRWLLSEPTERQLGERIEIESEHFDFRTYRWADPVNQRLVALMERARERVAAKIAFVPDRKFNVSVRPIFGIAPPQTAGALAYYKPGNRIAGDQIVIFAPESYAFGFYQGDVGWEKELEDTLTHEFTHLVHYRSEVPYFKLADWMFEGLAEYVSDSPRRPQVSAAVRSGQIIPIIDDSERVIKQDLEHLTQLEQDVGLAYGFAYSLVAYIAETQGGLDGFWKLARSYSTAPGVGKPHLDAALREAFGVSFEEFDAGWRAWLVETY